MTRRVTVATLFQTWDAVQDLLSNPTLSDEDTDALVDQARQLVMALTHTPAAGLVDVLLKLEAYGREAEAGPCEECDALLESALHDRGVILGRLERSGVAVASRHGHRPPSRERETQTREIEEVQADDDPLADPRARY